MKEYEILHKEKMAINQIKLDIILDNKSKELGYKVEFCEECDGDGVRRWSCCGDDITGNDIDLCPTCLEHCGDETEDCENCEGTGFTKV